MTPEPTPLVTVLPCDRTLFSYLLGWDVTDDTPRIATGAYDEHPKLQAIARHRLAALEEAAKVAEEVARRAAAVADERNKRGDPIDTAIASEIVAEKIATAIRSLSNKGGRDGE